MGIFDMMAKSLELPDSELAKLAELQHLEELKRKLAPPPAPLFQGVRELVLRKSKPESQEQVHAGFEKQPFGEVECLVTQNLLDVVKWVAGEELDSENWRTHAGFHSRVPGYRGFRRIDRKLPIIFGSADRILGH